MKILPAEELKEKAFKGVKLNSLAFLIVKISTLLRLVILAKILAPEDFGLMAFCLVVIGFLQNLMDLRIHEAIIQTKENEKDMLNAGFTAQFFASIILVIGVLIFSNSLSHILKKPFIAIYLRLLAIRVLTPAFIMPQALLYRKFDYKSIKVPEIADSLLNTLVAISLAMAGFGIWSLIWGCISGWLISVILILIIAKGLPPISFNSFLVKKALKFSFPLYLIFLLHWGFWNADDFIVGRLLGNRELGYYWMAFYLAHSLIDLRFILSRVSFPLFARLQEKKPQQAEVLTELTKSTAFIFFLIAALFIPLARPTLALIFGEKWLPATIPFMIFIALVSLRAIIDNGMDLLMGIARIKYIVLITLVQCLILFTLGPLASLKFGIRGMAVIVFLSAALAALRLIAYIKKIIDINYVKMLWKNALIAFLVGVIAFFLRPLTVNLTNFILVVLSCAILYIVLFIIFDKLFMKKLRVYLLTFLEV